MECAAVHGSALQHAMVCCVDLQSAVMNCGTGSLLRWAAECCGVLPCVVVGQDMLASVTEYGQVVQFDVISNSVLNDMKMRQCTTMCCGALQPLVLQLLNPETDQSFTKTKCIKPPLEV